MSQVRVELKFIFKCDSISRAYLWKVLEINVLKLINFEDFEVFTVRPTKDQQKTNRRPTENQQKTNRRPTEDQQKTNRISSEQIFLNVAEKLKINNHYRNIKDLTSANCTTSCNEILNVLGKGSFKRIKCEFSHFGSWPVLRELQRTIFFSIHSISHPFMPKNVFDNFCWEFVVLFLNAKIGNF